MSLKVPVDLDDFFIYRLYKLLIVARRGVDSAYRDELGIGRREMRILCYVEKFPGTTLKNLAEQSGIDSVVASRCVSEMAENGLLLKKRNEANHRFSVISLSEYGKDIHDRALDIGRRHNRALLEPFTASEARWLEDAMEKLAIQAETLGRMASASEESNDARASRPSLPRSEPPAR
ncbi:MAG: MarR family winged helix-turn-helix transcriptional regulator [Paraburkholderia sp.]|jgi:DNA-binding MarR family transcriptional regulator|nr:MarR family winged helix-turn-helix transcriptional regulator [Paraburkholderia sp.]